MSYCRFHNTVIDLNDCYNHIEDNLLEYERLSRTELINFCIEIANQYNDEEEEY